jgi:hypothetical protein
MHNSVREYDAKIYITIHRKFTLMLAFEIRLGQCKELIKINVLRKKTAL